MSRFSLVFSLMLSSTLGSSALYALKSTVAERHKSAFSKILSPGTEDVAYKAAHIMTENPAISQKEAVAQALSPAYTKGYQGEAIALRVAGRALQGEGFMLAQRALTIEGCKKDVDAFQFGGKDLAQQVAELFVDRKLSNLDVAKNQAMEGAIKLQATSLDDAQLKAVVATMRTKSATSLKKVLAEQFSVDYQVGGTGKQYKQYKLGNCVAAKILEGRNVLQAQADTKNEMQLFVNKLGKNIDVQGHVADNARRIACLDALKKSEDFKDQGWKWALGLSAKDLACYYRAANNLTPRCVGQWKKDRAQKVTDAENRYNAAVGARTAWEVAEDQKITNQRGFDRAGGSTLTQWKGGKRAALNVDPRHPDRVTWCEQIINNKKKGQVKGQTVLNLDYLSQDPFYVPPAFLQGIADDPTLYNQVMDTVLGYAEGLSLDQLQLLGELFPGDYAGKAAAEKKKSVIEGIKKFFDWGKGATSSDEEKKAWRQRALSIKEIFSVEALQTNPLLIGCLAAEGNKCQAASQQMLTSLLSNFEETGTVEQWIALNLAKWRLALLQAEAYQYAHARRFTDLEPEYKGYMAVAAKVNFSLPFPLETQANAGLVKLSSRATFESMFTDWTVENKECGTKKDPNLSDNTIVKKSEGFFGAYTPEKMVQKVLDILEPTCYEAGRDKSKIYIDQLIPVLQKLKPWCNMTTEQLEEADNAAGVILDDNYAIKKDFVKQLLIELGYLKIK